jgi:hypothetical protein
MPAALRGPLLATIEIQVTPAAQRFFNERLTYQDWHSGVAKTPFDARFRLDPPGKISAVRDHPNN